MDIFSIILIAIGLAMDCFAVSVSKGLATSCVVRPREQHCARFSPKALLMAVLFGVFQGGMPLIGYFAGTLFADFFSKFSPWIALGLLVFIGGKMIYESFHEDEDHHSAEDFSLKTLLLLAVATSIDALATGVIFIPVPERLWVGVGIIALVSFLFSIGGYLIGKYAGTRFHLNANLIGGIILILIGIKIWIEGVWM